MAEAIYKRRELHLPLLREREAMKKTICRSRCPRVLTCKMIQDILNLFTRCACFEWSHCNEYTGKKGCRGCPISKMEYRLAMILDPEEKRKGKR